MGELLQGMLKEAFGDASQDLKTPLKLGMIGAAPVLSLAL